MKISSLKSNFVIIIAIVIIYAIFHVLNIGCPIKFLTGISCAGCGMTRAYWYVLHFDFITAFSYHPLWPLAPFLLLLFFAQTKLNKKFYTISLVVILSIFAITYIIRLISPDDTVVIIDISQSAVVKLIKMFRRIFEL